MISTSTIKETGIKYFWKGLFWVKKNSPEYNYDSIILNTRSEAEDVLLALQDIIDTYSMASVADLYDLVGVIGAYTDNKYGWTDITGSRPNHTRDGWSLDLPRAVPLN